LSFDGHMNEKWPEVHDEPALTVGLFHFVKPRLKAQARIRRAALPATINVGALVGPVGIRGITE
jgi:hypothetical protein